MVLSASLVDQPPLQLLVSPNGGTGECLVPETVVKRRRLFESPHKLDAFPHYCQVYRGLHFSVSSKLVVSKVAYLQGAKSIVDL
jgi:hypothetical protein